MITPDQILTVKRAFKSGWDKKEAQLRDLFQGTPISFDEAWQEFLNEEARPDKHADNQTCCIQGFKHPSGHIRHVNESLCCCQMRPERET